MSTKASASLPFGVLLAGESCLTAAGQEVDPADNPLLGTWVLTGGAYACDASRTFARGSRRCGGDGQNGDEQDEAPHTIPSRRVSATGLGIGTVPPRHHDRSA